MPGQTRRATSDTARGQRRRLSHRYLSDWNNASLRGFDQEAKMSQFANLWRSFTCGQLEKLLDEYPDTNLPQVLRRRPAGMRQNDYLEQQFMYVSVVYREQIKETLPGLFSNPDRQRCPGFCAGHDLRSRAAADQETRAALRQPAAARVEPRRRAWRFRFAAGNR